MSGPRRKLSAVDDPLALGAGGASAMAAPPHSGAEERRATARPSSRDLPALFVRLPPGEFDALARAAFELKVHKRELVAALVWRYVRPTPEGLEALREVVDQHRGIAG
ncbi:MAG TPA: hypothetical protein VN238_17705 [Solirubrobacteraceae bacterium]|nr:hypothetical protein [Solirubrobacteraceae bacterium]